MPQIVIRIPPELRAQLEAAAKSDDRSLAALVRHILVKWVEGRPAAP